MTTRSDLARVLAVIGTLLSGLPLLVTILLSVGASLSRGALLLDWLMPAELFPVALVGGLLLVWAAAWARSRLRPIVASLALMVALLLGSQAFAVASGLADGRVSVGGWETWVVLAGLGLYAVAMVALCVYGWALTRELWANR